jgi:hypothetical protein
MINFFLYLYSLLAICLMTLPLPQTIQRRLIGQLMNNWQEGMWRELIVFSAFVWRIWTSHADPQVTRFPGQVHMRFTGNILNSPSQEQKLL